MCCHDAGLIFIRNVRKAIALHACAPGVRGRNSNDMTTRKPAAVSMDPALYERARSRAAELGFVTFSSYVCQLIRSDLHSGGGMTLVQDSPPSQPLPPRAAVAYEKTPRKKKTS